jgi:hypothetical protein
VANYSTAACTWLKERGGLKPIDVQRVARSGDWHGLLPEEIGEGQRRVIVNLETLEYLDPVRFGQAPTLAGMISDAPQDRDSPILKKAAAENRYFVDIAGALFCLLYYRDRRGGGHILSTAEIRYEDWPTTDEMIERGTDISDLALRYLAAVTHY